MGTRFKSLKEQLKVLEETGERKSLSHKRRSNLNTLSTKSGNRVRYFLLGGFLVTFLMYVTVRYNVATLPEVPNPVQSFVEWVNTPDEELLEAMGNRMEEMGYGGLTREDLIDLRRQGVTATFISRIRDIGYTGLTLDDAVRLSQNDVSSTFASMMKELGYELSVDDMVRLRQHGVTAFYTSNLHDLGYTSITIEELIRLRDVGVRVSDAERLISEGETLPGIEELIRYRISNQ